MLCSQKGRWVDEPRAARGCTLIDVTPIAWHVDAMAIRRGGWMGRAPVTQETADAMVAEITGVRARIDPRKPPEDPAEGCPGGYYRSLFVASVAPYLRRRDGQGNRVANPLLDRTDDEVLLQLVLYLEEQQERWESYRLEEVSRDG